MAGFSDPLTTPLVLAGLQPGDEPLYRAVLRNPGITTSRLGDLVVLSAEEIEAALGRLERARLVSVDDDGRIQAASPADVLSPLAQERAEALLREFDQVDALRDLIPALVVEQVSAQSGRRNEVDVQVVGTEDVLGLIRSLIEESEGDVLWFRPDQWRLTWVGEVDAMIADLIAAGRRSRAIYPAVVLEDAPEVVRSRAASGELVRIAASLPTRVAVFGSSAVLISERWGVDTGRRLVVREDSLVQAVTALFETAWERAIALPGLDAGIDHGAGERRLMLLQLARGAKDEQIARALGISLRTVRRRVAEIMAELGADSRFQAGVEAVRRGWV